MSLMTSQLLFCSGCGRPYKCDFNAGWISLAAHARVCSKECHDKVELAHARCIMGEPDPTDELQNAEKQS